VLIYQALKAENKELKKLNKEQKEEIESIKKRVSLMEKAKERWEVERHEKEELIKQLSEFNDELLNKFKKDAGNPAFKGLWYKKKKIEDKVSKFEKEAKSSRRESHREDSVT